MDRQTPKLLGSIWWGGSEAFFNFIKTPAHRHDTQRAPDSNGEKDEIIHLHFGNTHMHVHARVGKKAGRDTNPKMQTHTCRPQTETENKLSAEDTNTWWLSRLNPGLHHSVI